jgi:hypothetical protein
MLNTLRSVAWIDEAKLRNEATFVYSSYSGGVYNPYYGALGAHVIHGGGHSATQDNSVFVADYNTLRFERVWGPTLLAFEELEERIRFGGFVDDGRFNPREVSPGVPGSAHTDDCLLIVPPSVCGDPSGALLRPVAGAIGYSVSRATGWSHWFTMGDQKWSRMSSNASIRWSPGGSCAYDTERQKVWPLNVDNSDITASLSLTDRRWTNLSASPQGVAGYPDMVFSAFCKHRDVIVLSTNRETDTSARFYWFRAGTTGVMRTPVTFAQGNLPEASYGRGTLLYVEPLRKLIWFARAGGDNYYEIDVPADPAQPWNWEVKPITGPARPSLLSPAPAGSIYRRMDYAPQLKSLMWVTAQSASESLEFGGRVVAIRVVP